MLSGTDEPNKISNIFIAFFIDDKGSKFAENNAIKDYLIDEILML